MDAVSAAYEALGRERSELARYKRKNTELQNRIRELERQLSLSTQALSAFDEFDLLIENNRSALKGIK